MSKECEGLGVTDSLLEGEFDGCGIKVDAFQIDAAITISNSTNAQLRNAAFMP